MAGQRTLEREGAVPPLPDAESAWFLDIDGTLLEIAPTPSTVKVEDGLPELIRRLHQRCGGALALITGRPVSDVDRLFPGLRLPVAGQHGLERRDATGTVHRHPPEDADLPWLAALVKATVARLEGVWVEDKGLSIAVHYRANPAAQAAVDAALRGVLIDAGAALSLQPGKCVLEIKPEGRDKGSAIREFMAEQPFAGRRPVFVGDDVTDEFGFAEVNGLGGLAVKVGEGETAAPWRLRDVGEVHAWLAKTLADAPAGSLQEEHNNALTGSRARR